MNKKIFLLFSYTLTQAQEKDLRENWLVGEFIYLPDSLQKLWINIPPYKDTIIDYLEPIIKWLDKNSVREDLVQGDYGAVYIMCNWAFEKGLIPIYSTTERCVIEEIRTEATLIKRKISHYKFRMYERYF